MGRNLFRIINGLTDSSMNINGYKLKDDSTTVHSNARCRRKAALAKMVCINRRANIVKLLIALILSVKSGNIFNIVPLPHNGMQKGKSTLFNKPVKVLKAETAFSRQAGKVSD